MWPGFDSWTQHHAWVEVEFVVGSCPCSEGFSLGSQVFIPPYKPTHLNSNSTSKQHMKKLPCGNATANSHYLFIHLFTCIYLFIYLQNIILMVFTWSNPLKRIDRTRTVTSRLTPCRNPAHSSDTYDAPTITVLPGLCSNENRSSL